MAWTPEEDEIRAAEDHDKHQADWMRWRLERSEARDREEAKDERIEPEQFKRVR